MKIVLTLPGKQKGQTHLPYVKTDIGGQKQIKLNKTSTVNSYFIYHVFKKNLQFTPRMKINYHIT